MGALASLGFLVLGVIGTALAGFAARDAYACLPPFQGWLIRLAARRLPKELRKKYIEQWTADISDLPPSQIFRTLMAVDCIRGAFLISREISTGRARMRLLRAYAASSFYIRTRVTAMQSVLVRPYLHVRWLRHKPIVRASEHRFPFPYKPRDYIFGKRVFLDDWREIFLNTREAADRAAEAADDQARQTLGESF